MVDEDKNLGEVVVDRGGVLVDFALADLKVWIERGLERLKHRTVYADGDHHEAVNGYAYAEFSDWDLRQKVDLIESANSDAIRILDLNHRLVDCLKEALAQTGCDGDLCGYRWHDKARQLIAEVDEAIAADPAKQVTAEQRSGSELITVCDHCLQASCWQGVFYCDDYKTAGTVQKTRAELAALNREHPSYWKTDAEL